MYSVYILLKDPKEGKLHSWVCGPSEAALEISIGLLQIPYFLIMWENESLQNDLVKEHIQVQDWNTEFDGKENWKLAIVNDDTT